jgi:hypothetical protein
VVVAGLEPTGSFDRGDPAVGPSNQTASGAGICLANYCAEIVNPDRNNEYRSSIGELERCRCASSLRLCLCCTLSSISCAAGPIGYIGRKQFGLLKSLEAQNKTSEVEEVRKEFESAWKNADVRLKAGDL